MIERGAHGEAEGEAGDAEGARGEVLAQVEGSCVPFEGGVEGEDHLCCIGEAREDPLEVDGVAAIEGGEEVFDDVVEAAVAARFFKGVCIASGGEDAELGGISLGRAAEAAEPLIGEAATG